MSRVVVGRVRNAGQKRQLLWLPRTLLAHGGKQVRAGIAAVLRRGRHDPHTAAAGRPLQIRPVVSRGDLNQFCRVPWQIYADDPHWVPPLLLQVKEFLNPRKHPFYLHGAAAQFLAVRGGVPLGRILVSDDPHFNRRHGTNLGCFGMFECIQDPPTAHALLDAAADWLRRRGRSAVMGPVDYSTNYPCGLLIEGFDTPPRIMMNHNRPYYAELLESWGLAKAKDLYAWWFQDHHDLAAKWQRRAERLKRRNHISIRPTQKGRFDAEVRRCRTIYNGAMHDNWGSVALTDAEFRHLGKKIVQITVPELALLAEVDGRPVGFALTAPDVNEAIRPLDGRLTRLGLPINLVRLLYRRRRVKTARMIVLDILEGYRRRGVAEMLILRTLDYGKNTLGLTGAELSWTLEDNTLINRTLEAVGAQRYKTFRIYHGPLGP